MRALPIERGKRIGRLARVRLRVGEPERVAQIIGKPTLELRIDLDSARPRERVRRGMRIEQQTLLLREIVAELRGTRGLGLRCGVIARGVPGPVSGATRSVIASFSSLSSIGVLALLRRLFSPGERTTARSR